jgi:hypothetical protein
MFEPVAGEMTENAVDGGTMHELSIALSIVDMAQES